jgi:hypothetical protein
MWKCMQLFDKANCAWYGINLGGQLPHLSQRLLRHMALHSKLLFLFDLQGEGNFTHTRYLFTLLHPTHTQLKNEVCIKFSSHSYQSSLLRGYVPITKKLGLILYTEFPLWINI